MSQLASSMRLRATLRIRNDKVLRARESRGWSQQDLAESAGISLKSVLDIEKLDFRRKASEDAAVKIAAVLGLNTDDVMPMEMSGKYLDTNKESVKEIPMCMLLSDHPIAGLIEAPTENESITVTAEISDVLGKMMSTLTRREQDVLKMLYGLNGCPRHTLEEAGRKVRLTRERVRQIGNRAIRKLREPARLSHLHAAMDGESRQELLQRRAYDMDQKGPVCWSAKALKTLQELPSGDAEEDQ